MPTNKERVMRCLWVKPFFCELAIAELDEVAQEGEARGRSEMAAEALRVVQEWERECESGTVGWQPIVERIRALTRKGS